jgi:hypothetical protein
MNTEIIIIDDNISKTDPFVRVLQKTFSQYSIVDPFSKADDGVEYIFKNLNKKMITETTENVSEYFIHCIFYQISPKPPYFLLLL